MSGPPAVRYGIIADDLTGACDAGVQFARRGFATVVQMAPGRVQSPTEVTVLNTHSRADSPQTARRKVLEACRTLRGWGVRLIYKKIDSTLRGNVTAEIAAAMQATGRERAVVTPAFPAMGRTVAGGRLYVEGQLQAAMVLGEGLEMADAATQAELERMARAALEGWPEPLLAGSGGLVMEVARYLAERHGRHSPKRGRLRGGRGPAWLFIGSTNAATAAQVAALERQRAGALAEGRIGIERLRRSGTDMHKVMERIRALVEASTAGIFVTGGDTAQLVFGALGVESIRLVDEVATGIPWGWMGKGLADGRPVVTKAGGFGDEESLTKVADFLAPDCATVGA
jgi:D-threonate/D-erythronate kinase